MQKRKISLEKMPSEMNFKSWAGFLLRLEVEKTEEEQARGSLQGNPFKGITG